MSFGRKFGKYNAKKSEYNGMSFDSKKEMERYIELEKLQEEGKICKLQRQVKFELIPVQKEHYEVVKQLKTKVKVEKKERVVEHPCVYVADFVYMGYDNKWVVEDSKGIRTKEYKIKKKLMLYVYGIRIKET